MRIARTAGLAAAATLLLAACGSDDDETDADQPAGNGSTGDTDGGLPRDGTFATSIAADPGDLHPHLTLLSATRSVDAYLYDKLVYFSSDGEELPWLAESWEVEPTSVTYTIQDGVTCSDGSPLTAGDVAANFDFITDPDNESPAKGVLVPDEMDVTADDDARTVTIAVPEPDPFLLHTTGELFIACKAGLDDPDLLKSDAIGTAMYELSEAVPNDEYVLTRRDDYEWGPDGLTAGAGGTAASVTLRVIENESTAVNLFLDGELDAVSATGPDRQRLEGEYDQVTAKGTVGQLFYNQDEGRPGSDPAVREALSQALDYSELTPVITGGFGAQSKSTAAIEPTACSYDAVSGNLPEYDPEAAKATLDAAGWTANDGGTRSNDGQELAVTLVYNSTRGDTTASAAELIAQRWSDIGVDVTPRGMPPSEYNELMFGTSEWDAVLLPLNVRLQNQLIPFFSGPTPADGGVNFSYLQNDGYEAAVDAAMQLSADESCTEWQKADEALITNDDMMLFADETIPTFLDGVTMELGQDGILAPAIRITS